MEPHDKGVGPPKSQVEREIEEAVSGVGSPGEAMDQAALRARKREAERAALIEAIRKNPPSEIHLDRLVVSAEKMVTFMGIFCDQFEHTNKALGEINDNLGTVEAHLGGVYDTIVGIDKRLTFDHQGSEVGLARVMAELERTLSKVAHSVETIANN